VLLKVCTQCQPDSGCRCCEQSPMGGTTGSLTHCLCGCICVDWKEHTFIMGLLMTILHTMAKYKVKQSDSYIVKTVTQKHRCATTQYMESLGQIPSGCPIGRCADIQQLVCTWLISTTKIKLSSRDATTCPAESCKLDHSSTQLVLDFPATCDGAVQSTAEAQRLKLPWARQSRNPDPSYMLVTRPDLQLWRCQLCPTPQLPA
jgi:hypothetical protein